MAATYSAHNKHETNTYSLSGIRIRDPTNLAAAHLRLRPRNHRDL